MFVRMNVSQEPETIVVKLHNKPGDTMKEKQEMN